MERIFKLRSKIFKRIKNASHTVEEAYVPIGGNEY